jgi:hypothetical protein
MYFLTRRLRKEISLLKRALKRSINMAGFEVIRTSSAAALRGLEHYRMMRAVHSGDAREIEELYRRFVFHDLPDRKERAALLYELIGTSVGEGIYIVYYLNKSLTAHGDICEFGVAQGATSQLMAAEFQSEKERNLWLFDSFEGLPRPSPQDKLINDIFGLGSMAAYKGTMASPESEVLKKLAWIDFPRHRTKIKKGWVKDTISSGELPTQIAFAYIDLDFYDPIKDALHFVDSRMPIGGHIVVDDYGWFSEGAQVAVDEFMTAAKDRFRFEQPLACAGHFVLLSKIGA